MWCLYKYVGNTQGFTKQIQGYFRLFIKIAESEFATVLWVFIINKFLPNYVKYIQVNRSYIGQHQKIVLWAAIA